MNLGDLLSCGRTACAAIEQVAQLQEMLLCVVLSEVVSVSGPVSSDGLTVRFSDKEYYQFLLDDINLQPRKIVFILINVFYSPGLGKAKEAKYLKIFRKKKN